MKGLISALLVITCLGIYSCKGNTETTADGGKDAPAAADKALGNGDAPAWSDRLSIYEVNIRQYSADGSFASFTEAVPRLRDMGVGIVWLMPVHPIGEEKRKGTLGSYYSIKDYKGLNPEFGTEEDFRALVSAVHEADMKIILDWVPNHSSWDNPIKDEHPDWYTKDSLGNFQAPVEDWSDVCDLNYDNPGLRNYMVDAMKYWIEEFDIDGYRCDVAGFVPTTFWDSARVELDKLKDVFMLAEWEDSSLHFNAFDMTYGWEFHHLMNEIAQGKKGPADLDAYWTKEDRRFQPKDYRMQFITNHDENSWNGTEFERMGDAVEAMAVLSFTVPGMPLIYSGQEEPLDERLEFFEKDEIEWKDYAMLPFYTKLVLLKKAHPALWNGIHGGPLSKIANSAAEQVYSFSRSKDDDEIVVLLNLSDKPASFQLEGKEGTYIDYFSGIEVSLDGKLNLAPWRYHILKK